MQIVQKKISSSHNAPDTRPMYTGNGTPHKCPEKRIWQLVILAGIGILEQLYLHYDLVGILRSRYLCNIMKKEINQRLCKSTVIRQI